MSFYTTYYAGKTVLTNVPVINCAKETPSSPYSTEQWNTPQNGSYPLSLLFFPPSQGLAKLPRLASNLQFFCLSLLSKQDHSASQHLPYVGEVEGAGN